MTVIKNSLRPLTPPILWQLGGKINSRFRQRRSSTFEGPMRSWDDAAAQSDGWNAPVITSKTLDSALKVRDGLAEFEQDGVIRERIIYSTTVLSFIILALSRYPGQLNILEFGGGLGTGYFQNRKILRNLSGVKIAWNIVERPDLARLGARYFSQSDLKFFSSVDLAISGLEMVPNSYLFSGSLQCVAKPLALLDHTIELGARILAFDRLLVSPEKEHVVFIQHPDPTILYEATYPVWCFSKEKFIKRLESRGFTLVEEFTANPDANFDHCGMIFVR